MDFDSYKGMIINSISKLTECEIKHFNDSTTCRLLFTDEFANTLYLIRIYEIDGAGTIGMQIHWILGVVEDDVLVCKSLEANFNGCGIQDGPLFASIHRRDGENDLFALVGQLIFPPQTPPGEIATLFLNNVYLNYIMFDLSFDGVKPL